MKNILFLTGPHAVGKTYASKEICNSYENIDMIDTGPIMRQLYKESGFGSSIGEWVATLENNFGEDITSLLIATEIKKILSESYCDNIIVIGFRSLRGILYTAKYLNLDNYHVLFVDANRELLYENFLKREKNNISYQDFENYLDEELKSGLGEIRNCAVKNINSIKYYNICSDQDLLKKAIESYFMQERKLERKNEESYIWPVEPKYMVLDHDKYGLRPIHMILGKPRFHSGFDITSRTLTPIKASIGGIVLTAGLDEKIVSGSANWNERYGNKVEILDNYGRRLVYAHLREVLVREGQLIHQGEIVGLSGCSGGSRIPHLHFEVRKFNTSHSGEENTINPLDILPTYDLSLLTEHFDEPPYAEVWEKFLDNPWGITDKNIPYARSRKFIR